MDLAERIISQSTEKVSPAMHRQLLDLFDEVEDLLKRVADTEDMFLRHRRARVLAKLIAIKKEVLGN